MQNLSITFETQAELAAFGTTQTDESGSLPPPTPPQRQRRETSGRSAAAAASGCDIGTQLTDTELPSFDAEVNAEMSRNSASASYHSFLVI